jgi:hypothetical protein
MFNLNIFDNISRNIFFYKINKPRPKIFNNINRIIIIFNLTQLTEVPFLFRLSEKDNIPYNNNDKLYKITLNFGVEEQILQKDQLKNLDNMILIY